MEAFSEASSQGLHPRVRPRAHCCTICDRVIMAIRTCLIILFGVIVVSCGSVPEKSGFSQSDGALYTDDAVILNGTFFCIVSFGCQ